MVFKATMHAQAWRHRVTGDSVLYKNFAGQAHDHVTSKKGYTDYFNAKNLSVNNSSSDF